MSDGVRECIIHPFVQGEREREREKERAMDRWLHRCDINGRQVAWMRGCCRFLFSFLCHLLHATKRPPPLSPSLLPCLSELVTSSLTKYSTISSLIFPSTALVAIVRLSVKWEKGEHQSPGATRIHLVTMDTFCLLHSAPVSLSPSLCPPFPEP